MKFRAVYYLVLAFAFGLIAQMAAARSDVSIGVYGGHNESFDSDVTIVQPNGTDLTLGDIAWDGDSFEAPLYYGVRGTVWLDRAPGWGVMLDFTHAKVSFDSTQQVSASGRRDGVAVNAREAAGATFDTLEFTDGINLLTLNAVKRWDWGGRFNPYAGAGIGISVPHVEVQRSGSLLRTYEYQLTGVAAQALAGIEMKLGERFSVFGEYKISYAENDADLDQGGSLQTDIFTNHFVVGLSYRFGSSMAQSDSGVFK